MCRCAHMCIAKSLICRTLSVHEIKTCIIRKRHRQFLRLNENDIVLWFIYKSFNEKRIFQSFVYLKLFQSMGKIALFSSIDNVGTKAAAAAAETATIRKESAWK